LCILATYRSPRGNFNTFITNLDLILHKFFNFNNIICGDINVDCLTESYKKKLNKILQSFNLSSIVNFPTRISLNSFSTIDIFFIDNSYLNKLDIIPLINGLSDHDVQILIIQFAQQHIKDHFMSYKSNINQFAIADFLLKLSHETWDSVFEGNDVNTVFNSFLNTFLRHHYSSFPVIKVNKLSYHNSWITSGIRTSCQHKKLGNSNNPELFH
jgi:hypothetical protein